MVGQTLSHYKILEKLGSGGMGEVYVAEDTKLHRNVALKILPTAIATEERRHRFEREAQAIAALNHPNIVHVYSVDESEGVHFITMELVKGKTVTELIPKKGMSLNKFFEIAIPLANAVSAAHEKGIIHRDLKPDNLMVNEEGRLKILDFGLAKLKQEFAQEGMSDLPTQSATQEGRILGTVAYMSPEQTEGKSIDHRSDIFSMGIILYELVTGQRPFKGDTAASMLSSILRDEPVAVTDLNHALPRDLGKIVRRCLAKDPERRYQTAKDLRNEFDELKKELDSGEVLESTGPATGRSGARTKLIVAVSLAVIATFVLTLLLTRSAFETQPAANEGVLTQLTSQVGQELFPSLSPDGDTIVYASEASGNWDIYRQRAGGETTFNLTEDCLEDDFMPAFSPDGELIVFRSERDGGGIFVMGATGESARRLTDFGFNPAWSSNGENVLFTTQEIWRSGSRFRKSQLWIVNVASGESRIIAEGDAVQPSSSPHEERIAYWAIHKGGLHDIWTIPADGGEAVPVTDDAFVDWNPVWSSEGNYLYFSSDRGGSFNLWRVPIDEESGEVLGAPQSVTTGGSAERSHIGFSKDGSRMVYIERTDFRKTWRVALDPKTGTAQGDPQPITLGTIWEDSPAVSPDGDWLAFRTYVNQQEDLYIMRTDGTGRRQLTNDIHKDRDPSWSPDGKRISFYSNRSGIHDMWNIDPDGSGLTQLTRIPEWNVCCAAWAPDGLSMAYYSGDGNCYILDLGLAWDGQVPQRLPQLEGEQAFQPSSWSPDGKNLAGTVRNKPGVVIYSVEAKQYRRLTDIGWGPRWLPDSRRLLFLHSGNISLLDSESGNVQAPILTVAPDRIVRSFSISGDGRDLYFTRARTEADIWMLTLNRERK